jgi:hypothetical protein
MQAALPHAPEIPAAGAPRRREVRPAGRRAEHAETPWREGGTSGEDVEQALDALRSRFEEREGRVQEDQIEGARKPGRIQAQGVGTEDLGTIPVPAGLDVRPQHRQGVAPILDEDGPLRPSRESLDPEGPRPREEVQDDRSGDARSEDVEKRLALALEHGPRGEALRRPEAAATGLSGDHADAAHGTRRPSRRPGH